MGVWAGGASGPTRTCSTRADRALTEEAYERLKTIGEFTDLGSGFKIAMRDLEIRGAGNLLGGEQSGHIAAVGFDLYMEMVTEAVGELTGEVSEAPAEVAIDLPVSAHLPRDYVARDDVRMEAYRRLASVGSSGDVDDIEAEWTDRYGPPPAPAEALLEVARLRVECLRLGIEDVAVRRGRARFVGWELLKSQEIRLRRISASATYHDGAVTVPFSPEATGAAGRSVPGALLGLIAEIAPGESAPVPSAGS